MPAIDIFHLPSTGFIVDMLCMFDTFVANPEVDKEERDKALDLLVNALEAEAKESGYEAIICNSRLGAIINRAERF